MSTTNSIEQEIQSRASVAPRDARLQWIDWMIDQLRSEPTG